MPLSPLVLVSIPLVLASERASVFCGILTVNGGDAGARIIDTPYFLSCSEISNDLLTLVVLPSILLWEIVSCGGANIYTLVVPTS